MLQINKPQYSFEKITVEHIPGLIKAMKESLQPIVDHIKKDMYWNDDFKPKETEYKRRDGFIPHSHNHGGVELTAIIPECERHDFSWLEFGECDGEGECCEHGCSCDDEGHLSAFFRLWLKFEGIDESGKMTFYINLSGGNGDAPYFRSQYLPNIFESEFTAKDIPTFKKRMNTQVKKLMKVMA